MKQYSTVSDFLADLDPDKKEQVDLLRSVIMKAHAGITEHIKWNSPSYLLDGKDRITFNLLNKERVVKLILHMGSIRKEDKKAKLLLKDDKDLVEWRSEIRGIMTFANLADIRVKKADIATIISRWLDLDC